MATLGIVGSRKFNDFSEFSSIVNGWIKKNGVPDWIISGGCRGTDTLAERFAKENAIGFLDFPPDFETYGKDAYRERNRTIVNKSTHLLAFPSQKSSGTFMTINFAKNKPIPVEVHYID